MTSTATTRDAQHAFLRLLACPLVTPAVDQHLYRQVVVHQQEITASARRLGYRVQRVGSAVRLIRVPIGGTVTTPPRPRTAPTRRLMVLMCCLAACCEDVSGVVTLQKLSDMVRDLTASPGVTLSSYDPEDRAQRRQLRDAAGRLGDLGILRRRTSDETLLDAWTEEGAGIGAGYEIDRDALLLMTSPDVLDRALAAEPADAHDLASSRTVRQLRALAETPAVLYADLSAEDSEALRRERGWRTTDLAEITGGVVEARAEGLVLVLTGDDRPPTVADWPGAKAVDWVALLMADMAGRAGSRRPDGTVLLTSAEVDDVADDLTTWRGEYMNKHQQGNPGQVRADAEAVLTELGLLRVGVDGAWTVPPVAGRYRDPDTRFSDTTTTDSAR